MFYYKINDNDKNKRQKQKKTLGLSKFHAMNNHDGYA